MTETLTCNDCGQNWDRERTRGRKPSKCPQCSGAKPASIPKAKAKEVEVVKEVTRQYKARVQMKGQPVQWLGDPTPLTSKLNVYKGYETADGVIIQGTVVRAKGFSDRYRVQSVVQREDGTGYANLVGVSGSYEGKYRAININNITL